MPRIAPFGSLLYDDAVAGPIENLTAPPYDVIDETRRRGYVAASPHSIVHVDLAEGGDDPSVQGNRYERAAGLLHAWRQEGVLRRLPPSYFAYEMDFLDAVRGAPRRVRGLLCAMELEPWGGRILPHEHVMPGPVRDRLHLLRATRTHLSAVYGTVAGPHPTMTAALDGATAHTPLFAVTDREGVRHRMWRVDPQMPFAEWLAEDHLLIADGHHRYTTSLAYREERRAKDGPGPWDSVLTFVVDAASEDLQVLPYHRIQRRGVSPDTGELVSDLAALLSALDDTAGTVGVVTPGVTTPTLGLLRLPGGPPAVRALHETVLDRVTPEDAIAFTHEALDALDAVAEGAAVAAYLLPATTPEAILAVVERGERLPHKSTFFWPKPRTGMVLMPLDTSLF